NREAFVGDFSSDQPGLLLDGSGKHTVLLDWTARGEQNPEGVRFRWQVPASPQAVLELNLPAASTLTVDAGNSLVLGPEPAETPERRLWKVHFSNRSELDLTISTGPRDARGAEGAAALVIE